MTSVSRFMRHASVGISHLPEVKQRVGDQDDLAELAGLYREIVSTFNKVHYYVKRPDPTLAFLSAVALQKELDNHVKGIGFDLLSKYDAGDVSSLGASVRSAESALVAYISKGAVIKRYESVEEFLSAN